MVEFVSCSAGGGLAFWDSKSLAEKRRAQPFGLTDCPVASLSWGSGNSRLAVVPRWGERVGLAEVQEGTLEWSFLQHKGGVSFTCGCLLHSSQYLLTGGADSLVHIWDIKAGSIAKTFTGHTAPVTCIARSSNDQVIVSGSRSGSLLLHTVGTQQATTLTGEDSAMQSLNGVRFSVQEKSKVGTVCEDGGVSLWSVESQRLLTQFTPSHTASATDVCFSPSNNMLMVTAGMDARIYCWDIQQRKYVTTIPTPGPLTSVALLRDGSTLIGGGTNGKLYVYELRSMKTPRQTIEAHQSAVTCISEQRSRSSSRRSSARSSRDSRGLSSPAKSKQSSSAKHRDAAEATPTTEPSSSSHKLTPPSREESRGQEPESRSHQPRDETDGSSHSRPSPAQTTTAVGPQHGHKTLPEASSLGQAGRSELARTTATHPSVSQSQLGEFGSTITPFITHQHGGPQGPLGLNITAQTPFTAGHQPGRGWKDTAVFVTPAHMAKDTSGIFSPLESNLTTPLTTPLPGSKSTAAVPPTVRGSGGGGKQQAGGSHSHVVAPVQGGMAPGPGGMAPGPGGMAPGLGGMAPGPSGMAPGPGGMAPGPSGMAPGPGGMAPGPSGMAPGPGGIFSPLEGAVVAPPGQREASTEGSANSPQLKPSGEVYVHRTSSQPLLEQHHLSRNSAHPVSHGNTVAAPLFFPRPPQLPPAPASQRHAPLQEEQASSLVTSPKGVKGGVDSSTSSSVVEGGTPAPPMAPPHQTPPTKTGEPQGGAIQMQFMENLLKDSHEELRYALHRDIRALSLDMFRQFFIQQQQFATALGLLNEKVERLSEENHRLQEQLHQCMPKH